MINQELLNYIKQNLNEGKSLDVIKKSLFSGGGWKELDINEAVEELNSSVFNKIPQKPKKKLSSKKILLWLLFIIGVIAIFIFIGRTSSRVNEDYKKLDDDILVNRTSELSCNSGQIPFIEEGESIKNQTRKDFDKDGTEELVVIYGKLISGFEGMPTPSYRLTIFVCENEKLIEIYKINSYISESLDFIDYKSGFALVIPRGNWSLLLKSNGIFIETSPFEERNRVLQGMGVDFRDGYHVEVNVIDNKIEETLPGLSYGDALCCPSKPETRIVYEYVNGEFIVIKIDTWKEVTVNGREFKYPTNWICEYSNNTISNSCEVPSVNSHTYNYNLYPVLGSDDNFIFKSINPSDNQCQNWLGVYDYPREGCISKDGGKNYVVYTESDDLRISEALSLFLTINN